MRLFESLQLIRPPENTPRLRIKPTLGRITGLLTGTTHVICAKLGLVMLYIFFGWTLKANDTVKEMTPRPAAWTGIAQRKLVI